MAASSIVSAARAATREEFFGDQVDPTIDAIVSAYVDQELSLYASQTGRRNPKRFKLTGLDESVVRALWNSFQRKGGRNLIAEVNVNGGRKTQIAIKRSRDYIELSTFDPPA